MLSFSYFYYFVHIVYSNAFLHSKCLINIPNIQGPALNTLSLEMSENLSLLGTEFLWCQVNIRLNDSWCFHVIAIGLYALETGTTPCMYTLSAYWSTAYSGSGRLWGHAVCVRGMSGSPSVMCVIHWLLAIGLPPSDTLSDNRLLKAQTQDHKLLTRVPINLYFMWSMLFLTTGPIPLEIT